MRQTKDSLQVFSSKKSAQRSENSPKSASKAKGDGGVVVTTGKKQRPAFGPNHFTTVTPSNLGKMSQNFSNLANGFSDDSDDDQGYL